MAHEQGLPPTCVEHRFELERIALQGILDRRLTQPNSVVLDLGCGSGEWTAHFAGSAKRVVGVERSGPMVAAARARTRGMSNVEIVQSDVLDYALVTPVELVFLGGLLMYLDRPDAVSLLRRCGTELMEDGILIARESTVPEGVVVRSDGYHAVYRSTDEYRKIAAEAGLVVVETLENVGYRHMEIASQLSESIIRTPGLSRLGSGVIGPLVWRAVAASGTLGMDLLPRATRRLGKRFPRLSNHFFVLRRAAD